MVGASTPLANEGHRGAGGVGVLEGRRGLCGASSRGTTRRHSGDASEEG